MVLVRETVPDDWRALRDIRLTALRDEPDAFGSTYAEQVARLLYERCGFSPTGERQPLPSNPAIGEVGMTRPL